MNTAPVISLKNVSFLYREIPVLEDVSLTIEKRDFLAVVGPNAGGKTTLLKIMLGLLKPMRGDVRIFGDPPERARSRMGYMPQYARLDPLFPVNVLDVVLMGRLGVSIKPGRYGRSDRQAAEEALRKLELTGVTHSAFSALSGGQRQRVLIARALASSPELLLLDEPTANVDTVVETEFYEILKRLNAEMTIVLVTHDLGFVSRYVKHVACVNRRVVVHPTHEITGEVINKVYGRDVRMVRHDEIRVSDRVHRDG